MKPRTLNRYRELLKLHVLPVIGGVQLSKLKPLHLEKIYAEGRKKGLSERTLLHVHRVTYGALRQAVRWQLISRNPAEAVVAPRPAHREVEPMEPADGLRLLESLRETDLHMPAVLALGTGMRLGEVLGLRWRDVDLDRGTARVTQALQMDMTFSTPKSHRSRRLVSLPDFVLEALRFHRKAQSGRRLLCGDGWHDMDLVIDRGDGQPLNHRSVSKRFASTARRAGIELTFHGLRHGYASLMLASGVDLKVTSGLLGHSSYSITADLYTHVAERVDHEAAQRLDAYITGSIAR